MTTLTVKDLLPEDGTKGTLVGRVWLPQANGAVACLPLTLQTRPIFGVHRRLGRNGGTKRSQLKSTVSGGFRTS